MGSIVEELQRDALDPNVAVSDVLRKALVVASKLCVSELKTWIERELYGYGPGDDVPEYRRMQGEVMAWHPTNGWLPVHLEDSAWHAKLTRQPCLQSVAQTESIARDAPVDAVITMHYLPETEHRLMEIIRSSSPPVLHVQPSVFSAMLDAVRNAVLEWALQLESDGILGADMGFAPAEKAAAAAREYSVNINAPVSQLQIQQDSDGSTQVVEQTDLDLAAVARLVEALLAAIADSSQIASAPGSVTMVFSNGWLEHCTAMEPRRANLPPFFFHAKFIIVCWIRHSSEPRTTARSSFVRSW